MASISGSDFRQVDDLHNFHSQLEQAQGQLHARRFQSQVQLLLLCHIYRNLRMACMKLVEVVAVVVGDSWRMSRICP